MDRLPIRVRVELTLGCFLQLRVAGGPMNRFKMIIFFSILLSQYQNCAPARFEFTSKSAGVNDNGPTKRGTTGDSGTGDDTGGSTGGTTGSTSGTTTGSTTGSTGETTGSTGETTGSTGETTGSTGGTTGTTGETTGTSGGTTGSTGGDTGSTGGDTGHSEFPPLGGYATVVYEDLFPRPLNENDRDYNDIVIGFKINETYNNLGRLEKIEVYFVPRGRSAGYDHRFYVSLDGEPDRGGPSTVPMFNGSAKSMTLEYYSDSNFSAASKLSSANVPLKSQDLVIYEKTSEIFGMYNANNGEGSDYIHPRQVAKLTVILEPSANNLRPEKFDIRHYRMMLYVHNTEKDIDLIDVNPAQFSIDGTEIYPYGMVVPDDFKYPRDGVNIDQVYPKFRPYRQYLLNKMNDSTATAPADVLNWFNYPGPGTAPLLYDRSLFP